MTKLAADAATTVEGNDKPRSPNVKLRGAVLHEGSCRAAKAETLCSMTESLGRFGTCRNARQNHKPNSIAAATFSDSLGRRQTCYFGIVWLVSTQGRCRSGPGAEKTTWGSGLVQAVFDS